MSKKFFAAIAAIVIGFGASLALGEFNTSGRWASTDSGVVHVDSSGTVTASAVVSADITDGTITAADLGANSVDSSELVNGSVDPAHLADDDFGNFTCASGLCSLDADVVALTQISDTWSFDGPQTFVSGNGEGLLMTHVMTDATDETAHSLTVTAKDTTSSTTAQYGLYLDNADSTEGSDAMLVIDNSDADDAVAAGILFVDAGGGFTNAIDTAGGAISTGNIVTSGTLLGTGTGSLGWSVQTGTNTACTATCTTPAVFGVDSGGTGLIVGPADATAEECVCAGAN